MDPRHVEDVLEVADVVQIGARNMQNFLLLAEVGRTDKPILLKRGPSASVEELMAAERREGGKADHPLRARDQDLRGSLRYTLDLGSVAVLKGDAPAS